MVVGAPRGPAGMRRPDPSNRARADGGNSGKIAREAERRKRDKDGRERKNDSGAGCAGGGLEKEAKTTMTDFRIVGIEFGELNWSWGAVGGLENLQVEEEVKKENGDGGHDEKTEDPIVNGAKTAAEEAEIPVVIPDSGAAAADVEVKQESEETTESADPVEEKRGEKRKAKTTSPDGGESLILQRSNAMTIQENAAEHPQMQKMTARSLPKSARQLISSPTGNLTTPNQRHK